MSRNFTPLATALIATLLGTTAYADTDTGKTRDEVRAETLAAIRNGDMLEANGLTEREMFPGLFTAAPAVAGKTRGEVRAELAEAIHNGDMLANGRVTMTLREEFPSQYPPQ